MSPARVTFKRTLAQTKNHISGIFTCAGFLSAFAIAFAYQLRAAEGSPMTLATVWAISVAPFLPGLAAFLAMDSFSEERRSGRMDMLLSVAIRERDLTMGKMLGVFAATMMTVLVSMVSILGFMLVYSGPNFTGMGLMSFLPALAILTLQGATWCAISVLTSAMFVRAAVSAAVSLALTVALPRGLWAAILYWYPDARAALGEMPLDAHVLDFASGTIAISTVIGYLLVATMALGLAPKSVASLRLRGVGGRLGKFSTAIVTVLALVLTVALINLSNRVTMVIDCSSGGATTLSARTRHILSETHDKLSIKCFMARSSREFRSVGRFLRELKNTSAALGATGISVAFVDPNWDIASSQHLIALGAREPSLVFENGRHIAILSLSGGVDEHSVASTIQSVTMPPHRKNVYWTCGHGETGFDRYDQWGMSDIARELVRDGYRNHYLDLATTKEMPNDCAFIIIVGAKNDFSRMELGRIDAYLKQGGRMMVLMSQGRSGGVASMLSSWGVRVKETPVDSMRTLNGIDIVVSDFSSHVVSSPLSGSSVVLGKPLVFEASSAAMVTGADKLEFTVLAKAGTSPVAVAVERGMGVGTDLALRPTRIIVIGDSGFVLNSSLTARANANRDFFLNAAAYLSGMDTASASGVSAMLLNSGMERNDRLDMMMGTALWFPLAFFAFFAIGIIRRRKRE